MVCLHAHASFKLPVLIGSPSGSIFDRRELVMKRSGLACIQHEADLFMVRRQMFYLWDGVLQGRGVEEAN